MNAVKINRFLKKLQNFIFYKHDLDLKTVKKVVQIFYACLSPHEAKKWQVSIDMILTHTISQQSIVDNINQATIDTLVKDLNKLEKELAKKE